MTDEIPLYGNFRRNVRQLLGEYEWNQDDLAAAMGCTKSHVSQLLSGRSGPGLLTLHTVAEALDCTAADLISEESLTGG